MLSVNQHTVDTAKMLLFHRSEIKIILLITKLYHSLFTHKTNSSLINRKSHTVIHVAGRKDRARPIPRTPRTRRSATANRRRLRSADCGV